MAIPEDSMEIKTRKMSRIMEVDVAALDVGGAREAMVECKETMIQVPILNAIIVES